MPKQLLGISWPFRIEQNGLPAPAKGVDTIRSALILLLKTRKGSRVFRPTLGTELHKLVFENQGPLLHSLVKREIFAAVSDWLPQVQIIDIVVSESEKVVRVNVTYSAQGIVDETGLIDIGDSEA